MLRHDYLDRLLADDPVELPGAGSAVSRHGDVWALGVHRLICGDARFIETYHILLDGGIAGMVFSDVPFNVPVNGHVSGANPRYKRASSHS